MCSPETEISLHLESFLSSRNFCWKQHLSVRQCLPVLKNYLKHSICLKNFPNNLVGEKIVKLFRRFLTIWYCLDKFPELLLKWIFYGHLNIYEAVSGWGPGFDLSPKNAHFWETYFKDQNRDTQIFGLIAKM